MNETMSNTINHDLNLHVGTVDCERIINLSNYEAQRLKALEELSELSVELAKKSTPARIRSEMADVYIMLKQIELMYDINPVLLQNDINGKLERTLTRLERGRANSYGTD